MGFIAVLREYLELRWEDLQHASFTVGEQAPRGAGLEMGPQETYEERETICI